MGDGVGEPLNRLNIEPRVRFRDCAIRLIVGVGRNGLLDVQEAVSSVLVVGLNGRCMHIRANNVEWEYATSRKGLCSCGGRSIPGLERA